MSPSGSSKAPGAERRPGLGELEKAGRGAMKRIGGHTVPRCRTGTCRKGEAQCGEYG